MFNMRKPSFPETMIWMILCLTCIFNAGGAEAQEHSTLENAVICGYQGWFACYGDGSPIDRWNHWCGGQYQSDTPKPSPGYQSFEVYPDISEYPDRVLYQTGYDSLGDGRPARLFSSYNEETIDLHVSWMEENGIDGAALQRFLSETNDPVYKAHRDSVAARLMRAAEKHNRMFYIMYDGIGNDIDHLIDDWSSTMTGVLHVTESPAYAYMDGKPVVCFWGFGFTHYSDTPDEALRAVNWFKDNGYYVIGGTPTNWRTGTSDSKEGYEEVYQAYDMISPWTPGRYKTDTEVDNFKETMIAPDKTLLDEWGSDYMPVIFPGFAWSNWNGGAVNDFPRRQGNFMWRQFYNINDLGINHVYIAMFDEYDEGTNIAKAAADYFDIPTDQYFQTMSIDGEYISSDFYLRLAGAAASVLKGSLEATLEVPIPDSEGPVYFRSSFEPVDATLTWTSTSDEDNGGIQNVTGPVCEISTAAALSGSSSVHYSGTAGSAGHSLAYFRAVDVNIPVYSNTTLSYAIKPENELSRSAGIDLLMTDGTTMRGSGVQDTTGLSIHPGTPRGTVGEWTKIKCVIGNLFAGKTIDRVLIAFDNEEATGEINGFIDDVVIQTEDVETGSEKNNNSFGLDKNRMPSVRYLNNRLVFDRPQTDREYTPGVEIYSINGKLIKQWEGSFLSKKLKLSNGIYFIKMSAKKGNMKTVKMIVKK